jgi:hypothetical protein
VKNIFRPKSRRQTRPAAPSAPSRSKAPLLLSCEAWSDIAWEKVKNAFEMIDDTLGLDTRGTIKGILEQGVKGTIINGIKKSKKDE